MSSASVRAVGEASFVGPLLPQTFPWFKENGGWAGIARIVRRLGIEVGHVSWRTEGLVALQSSAAGSVVVTKPLRHGGTDSGCVRVSASLNYHGGNASVELLDRQGEALPGFSGAAAAIIAPGTDAVALPLFFGRPGAATGDLEVGPEGTGLDA